MQVNPYALIFPSLLPASQKPNKEASVNQDSIIGLTSLQGGLEFDLQELEQLNHKYPALRLCSWPCLRGRGDCVNMVSVYSGGTTISLHFDLFEFCCVLQFEQQND